MPFTPHQRERYARQLVLPELGAQGQRRLAGAKVAIVGVGGLGSTVATSLAAAGIGHLSLIDPDPLERSNLHRQTLYRDGQVGQSKVSSAREQLLALNPDINVTTYQVSLTSGNTKTLLPGHHLIIDGSDNFLTRQVLHHACGDLGLPWVYGAAEMLHGQLSVFWPNQRPGFNPCYACLFPTQGQAEEGGCAQRGVLGMVPGIIAQLQAVEAVKLLTGLGTSLIGTLVNYDAANARFRHSRFRADPDCPCRHWQPTALTLPLP